MKTNIKNQLLLSSLLVVLNLLPAGRVTAQTFTTLHSFTGGSDGANPYAGLILWSNTLYGTAAGGGSSRGGTVFAINTEGTGFTNLHSFQGGSDGYYPYAGLILSGNTLYGTAIYGGNFYEGTVFSVNTGGTGFATLHSFQPSPLSEVNCVTFFDCPCGFQCFAGSSHSYCRRVWFCNGDTGDTEGQNPHAGLIISGNTLYGTTKGDWESGDGSAFAVHTDGTGFMNLHSFSGSDGAFPTAGLILSGNTLYGTTKGDWESNIGGGVFAVNTDGSGFRYMGGLSSRAGLILSGNTLYGTASQGGSSGYGTVFALNTDGTGFTNLHSFTAWTTNSSGVYTNSDGTFPYAGLVLAGNTLYGTASAGGGSGKGTVFALHTDGTGFTNLHSFSGSDGAFPHAGLVLAGNTLYGTASAGGSLGGGTVFGLSFRPEPTITASGTNVILSWSASVAGFDYCGYTLQSTTNLGSSAVWATNSPAPVVVNGQLTVTNSISGTQQFFRLIQ